MWLSHTRINYRLFLTILAGGFIIANSLLLVMIQWLDVEITSPGWVGLLIIEAVSALSGFALSKRIFVSIRDKEMTPYQQEQALLLQQLKEARDPHSRQVILDKMMAEDLLCGADLSDITLYDIHLESANLESADLCGCTLPHADLAGANLQHALLSQANLKNADLMNTNLRDAQLTHIHFDGATLANANLSGANLQYACLRGTSLYDAELEGTQLDYADLGGSCLLFANLSKATLNGARFDEMTVLPDGEQWTATTDLRRFTDHTHPQFVSYKGQDSPAFKERSTSLAD